MTLDLTPVAEDFTASASQAYDLVAVVESALHAAREAVERLYTQIEWMQEFAADISKAAAVHKTVSATAAVAFADLHAESLNEGFDPRGEFVYMLWGSDGSRPLYVGYSSNVLSRLGSHLGSKDRGPLVERVSLTRCASRAHALLLEAQLIAHLQPPLNTSRPNVPRLSAAYETESAA